MKGIHKVLDLKNSDEDEEEEEEERVTQKFLTEKLCCPMAPAARKSQVVSVGYPWRVHWGLFGGN